MTGNLHNARTSLHAAHRPLHHRDRLVLFGIFALFALIFANISLPNHLLFRTSGWDLGYFNSAIYDYSRFQWNIYDLYIYGGFDNTLGDHFSPILMFLSPLRYVFGSWTLLIVQLAAVLLGGWGFFRLVRTFNQDTWFAHLALAHFFSIWGIYSALSFDYHNVVLAAMLVPWLLYFLTLHNFRAALLCFLLALCCKESVALWLLFVCMGWAWWQRKDAWIRKRSLALAGGAVVWFFAVTAWVIPAINGKRYLHFAYNALGDNNGEALQTIFTRPFYVLGLLFQNTIPDRPDFDTVKIELHFMTLLAGGFALLRYPAFLLMLLPLLGQKLLSDRPGVWGINKHYSIEFVPILSLALFSLLHRLKGEKRRLLLGGAMVVITLGSTISSFWWRNSSYYEPEKINFLTAQHYQQDEADAGAIRAAMALIPDDAAACVTSPVTPHLAMRDKLYMWPKVDDAEYVLVSKRYGTYPMSARKSKAKLKSLIKSGEWEKLSDVNDVILLKRIVR